MPTIMSHGVVGAAAASVFGLRGDFRWIAAGCAMLPDIDVASFAFGVPYGDVLGHRGITHSLAFAAALSIMVAAFPAPNRVRRGSCVFVATASHGFLDALTNGGLGVAFLAPFDNTRYFFPWTPIPVSPIGAGFFSERGAEVFVVEILLLWIPALAVIWLARLWRTL